MKTLGIIAWVIIGWVLGLLLFFNFSGLPKQEGYLAMMSAFVGGPIGAVAGVVVALKMFRRFEGEAQRKFVGLSILGVFLAVALMFALAK